MSPEVFSSGYLVFRLGRPIQFLLMKHASRWDLPKGHMDPGETPLQTALRELEEETGIPEQEIWTDPDFIYEQEYTVQVNKRAKLKKLSIYLGWLRTDRSLVLTEHEGYRWFDWSPPHTIQLQTIDPLLTKVSEHLAKPSVWPPPEATRV
jgi:8-oxo-dGTP pyrophosphatase MutT (NUDIX family)